MFRGRFFSFLLAMLLVVGLLGLAGSSIYRAGWTQGYFTGKISDGGEAGQTTVVTPDPAPGRAPVYGWGLSPGGSFFGAIVKVFLVIFLIGMFFKFIGLLFWRKRGYPGGRGGWGPDGGCGPHGDSRRWGKHYGHTPPWYDDKSEEPVMKA
jgi:hypothetical protein